MSVAESRRRTVPFHHEGVDGAAPGSRTQWANRECLQGVGIQLYQVTRDVSFGVVVRYCHPRHRIRCRSVDRIKGDVGARLHNHLADDATRYAHRNAQHFLGRGFEAQFHGILADTNLCTLAVFLVPYIQLVFGLEVVIRSFQRRIPFPQRGKWNVTICLAIVGTLLLVTYLVTHFIRPPNFCFASLFWFLQSYKRGALVLFSLIAVSLLASTVIIFFKLHRNASIDPLERVAASRMVFYLSLGFISAVSNPWPPSRANAVTHNQTDTGHSLLSRH